MRKYIVIVCILLSSIVARSQTAYDVTVCYGEPIYLFCNFPQGCLTEGAKFYWENFSGSWKSSERDPVLYPLEDSLCVGDQLFPGNGYATDKFYLSAQFAPPPGGFYGGRVTVTVYPKIVTSSVITPNLCSIDNDGQINMTISGGTPPYTYLWSNGITTQDLTGLTSGTYTVTITDARPCTEIVSWVVGSTYSNITTTKHDTYCRGNNGAIHLTANTNCLVPPFAFQWSNGSTNQFINGLSPGTYTVTVTDSAPSTTVLSTIIE